MMRALVIASKRGGLADCGVEDALVERAAGGVRADSRSTRGACVGVGSELPFFLRGCSAGGCGEVTSHALAGLRVCADVL
jgi:hypothetical protein